MEATKIIDGEDTFIRVFHIENGVKIMVETKTNKYGLTMVITVAIDIKTGEETLLSLQSYRIGSKIFIYIDDNGRLITRANIKTDRITID